MKSVLREMTRADHAAVDGLLSRFDLSDKAGYGKFLQAIAKAHSPIEDALHDAGAGKLVSGWSEGRRADLLRADLRDLGIDTPAPLVSPTFRCADELLGGIYVLEGSRLGGTVLSSMLSHGTPARFLTAPTAPGTWRRLLVQLDAELGDAARLERAAKSARACFELFERAATTNWEMLVA